MSREIGYVDGNVKLRGLLEEPDAAPARAAVLVCHEAMGLTLHVRRRIKMLAAIGYSAFALDMFGDGSPPLTDQAVVRPRLQGWLQDRIALRRRAQAGFDALVRHTTAPAGKVFAIGFCFGGTTALELARAGLPLTGVVSFHGGLKAPLPAALGTVNAPILSCVGAEDPTIPLEDRTAFEQEMNTAGATWQTVLYSGVGHSYTNKDIPVQPGFSYHAWADEQSWSAMRSFFDGLLQQ
jgi:dienelactone hydrolase